MRMRVERFLPALSSLRGHRPAQEIRCPAVRKRDMSVPISSSVERSGFTFSLALTELELSAVRLRKELEE